jgi:hypothetical protein
MADLLKCQPGAIERLRASLLKLTGYGMIPDIRFNGPEIMNSYYKSLAILIFGLSLPLFQTITIAADEDFHLHQEGVGQWVLEAPEPHGTNQHQRWQVERVPGKNEPDQTPIPIVGGWVVESGRVLFRPKYPFREAMAYQVVEQSSDSNARFILRYRFVIPLSGGPEPQVVSLQPAGERWPENLLRVYLTFNRPMARGEAAKRITIEDSSGRRLIQPFLELDQELWDKSGRRLTLLFDPGRVKSGLKPREEDGAILEKGQKYNIKVADGWPDDRGIAMKKSFSKVIEVGPADHEPVEPRKWQLAAPTAKAGEPLVIRFNEPVDSGMAIRMIGILESGECPLDGTAEISPDGLTWKFVPDVKWSPGLHYIEVNPALEDPSGNQVGRPFERDMQAERSESLMKSAKPVRLTFVVRIADE